MRWENICRGLKYQELIKERIIAIAHEIDEIDISKSTSPFSLFTGYLGIVIFYTYLSKEMLQEKATQNAINYLNKSINILGKMEHINYSFSEGFSGVKWSLKFLQDEGLIASQQDVNESIIDLHNIDDINLTKSYDYLYGGLSSCLTAIAYISNKNSVKYLTNIVAKLYEIADKKYTNEYSWVSYDHNGLIPQYNLGLSHGIPSIISIICLIYECGIQKRLCLNLLNGAINWILKHKHSDDSLSMFPTAIPKDQSTTQSRSSRLGWCYGDLGIARSLWLAGKVTNNNTWKDEAVKIMLHASIRKNLNENIVLDAGLCHGSVGIAHIFNRFYQDTQIETFKETSLYWYKVTLDFAQFRDGIGGYKIYLSSEMKEENGKWINSSDFIDGSTGIGLALLAAVSDIEPKWDRCLLLS